ncbi:Oidioi.mRNA.OKI2018_I69.XSR.g14427.t1.cds [Oikopleura dioica]|uniref:Oidioi.mRNA.OKI2018_I69.XSR.g14427.t1.cds n=1 Tax=Oikopleura dioica TaxID=34765 RepID=A0ABN7SER5_OIKDI|nr:Oidioi.mRNA.OKI2018_I69.XSR.g14427.t1.cds [Oikopleura dioica]
MATTDNRGLDQWSNLPALLFFSSSSRKVTELDDDPGKFFFKISISTIEQPYYSGLDFETTVVDIEDDDFLHSRIHAKFIKTSTGQWKSEYRELSPPKEEVSYILINLVRCTGCDRYSYPVST